MNLPTRQVDRERQVIGCLFGTFAKRRRWPCIPIRDVLARSNMRRRAMIKSLRTSILTAIFLAGSLALAVAQAVPQGEGGGGGGAGYKSGTSETGPAPSPTAPSPGTTGAT